MMRIGAVAAIGIDRNSGEKNIARAKHIATVNEVSPERPPAMIPEVHSTSVTGVFVPKHDPVIMEKASA